MSNIQVSVTTDNEVQFEGRCAYPGIPNERVSKPVADAAGINFGRGVALLASNPNKCRLLRSNTTTLTLDGDLVASNVLAGNIVINGATTAYTETYATSHAATMAALVAELDALTNVTAVLTSSRVITVTAAEGSDVYFSTGAVTLGGTQAAVALANTESANVFGFTQYAEVEPDSNGNALYEQNVTATIGRDTYIDVRSDDALAVGAAVYVRFLDESSVAADKAAGMLMATAGTASNVTRAKLLAGAEVYKSCAAGGIATIRVRI